MANNYAEAASSSAASLAGAVTDVAIASTSELVSVEAVTSPLSADSELP